ncbi:class I SAM-dependent methyltransferase [bacterium]|nr:class I SAM-dependent methyltransferase [bacterium]
MTGWLLYWISQLFGKGPLSRNDFQRIVDACSSQHSTDLVKIFGRLICLQPVMKAVEEHISEREGTVVDLGCGYGLIGILLSMRYRLSVIGMEASLSRLDAARQLSRGLAETRFEHGDIANIQIPPSTAILLVDVLCFFSDDVQKRIISACTESLMPGGALFIKDNTTKPRWKYRYTYAEESLKLWTGVYGLKNRHRPNYRSPESWRGLITHAGMQVQNEIFIRSFVPYPGIIYVAQKSN